MIQTCKWMGTLLCAGGILLTSFNIYPLNIVLGLIGSGLWVLAAWKTKDTPLFTIEFYSTIVYFMGLITWAFSSSTLDKEDPIYQIPKMEQRHNLGKSGKDFDEEEPKIRKLNPLDPT